MATFQVIDGTLLDTDEMLIHNLTKKTIAKDTSDLVATGAKTTAAPADDLDLVATSSKSHKKHEKNKSKDDNKRTEQVAPGFEVIGIGKPLSIEIATVYVGEYVKFLGRKKDVIVVSGVKSAQTFNGTSRAINIKTHKAEENSFLNFTAFDDGTPLVYYTPSMDADSMQVSFEIMFDNFDKETFDTISGLMNSAAGIPVFLPAAGYLLAGAQLVKLGAGLADVLFSGAPNLAGTIPIQFNSPILPPTQPREYVLYNERDKEEFLDLKVAITITGEIKKLRLVNKKTNDEYKGRAPYMIILLDGRAQIARKSFAPTLASASMLAKFYGPQQPSAEITGILKDAMQLYNDSAYKSKGEKISKRLKTTNKDSDEFKTLSSLYNAYKENIQDDAFQLPEI